MKKLEEARRSLQKTKESAQAQLVALDIKRKEIKASIRAIDSALRTLDSSNSVKANASVSTNEVVALATNILRSDKPFTQDSLLEELRKQLVAANRSCNGLKLRFIQALKREQFVTEKSGKITIQ